MPKILIIDDDPRICRLVVDALTNAGYETLEANDGAEGLRRARIDRPALIITDILMPQADGLEVIRALGRDPHRLPIIAISDGKPIFLRAAEKFGADMTLAKPFGAEELVDAVRSLLGT